MVTSSAGVAVSLRRLAIFAVAENLLPFREVNQWEVDCVIPWYFVCLSWCAKLQPVEINITK